MIITLKIMRIENIYKVLEKYETSVFFYCLVKSSLLPSFWIISLVMKLHLRIFWIYRPKFLQIIYLVIIIAVLLKKLGAI